uniref:Uncharacterized protein n=1 Tax=Anguilla anguilla TaxID=7936 RepID=A0A0E9PXW3_ANGAN
MLNDSPPHWNMIQKTMIGILRKSI